MGQYEEYNGDLVADWSAAASVDRVSISTSATSGSAHHRARSQLAQLAGHRSAAGWALGGALANENLGVTFDFQAGHAEGIHVGVRTLVELGAIETMGKLTRVPYWGCLQVASTEPGVQRELHDWWSDMDERERLLFVERSLVAHGFMEGPPDGLPDPVGREAIARYQAEQDLVVSGRPTLQLYASLLGSDRPVSLGAPATYPDEGELPDPVADALPVPEPVQIELYTDRGREPVYAPLESLRAHVRVSGNAYVACYYQEAGGGVVQVFPNRFQPQGYVAAGEIVALPGRRAGFQIVPEQAGAQEQLMCVASPREITSHLPDELRVRDLVPMPIESLEALAETFRGIDRASVSQALLPISVAAGL